MKNFVTLAAAIMALVLGTCYSACAAPEQAGNFAGLAAKGPYVDTRDFTSFSDALAYVSLQTTPYKTLVVTRDETLNNPVIVDQGINLVILKGARFINGVDGKLTIKGNFEAPLTEVFSGFTNGGVVFEASTVKEVYPQWWGARPDDNVDDSGAIQAAIDTGKKVYIPAGTYLLSSSLKILTSGQTIVGESPVKTILKNNSVTLPRLLQLGDPNKWFIQNVYISNIQFDGVKNGNFKYTARGIDIQFCNSYKIDRCFVKNCDYGIWVDGAATPKTRSNFDLTITGSQFKENRIAGIRLGYCANAVNILNSFFEYNYDLSNAQNITAGILVEDVAIMLNIKDCIIQYNGITDYTPNSVYANKGYGIFLKGAYSATINGNYFEHQTVDIYLTRSPPDAVLANYNNSSVNASNNYHAGSLNGIYAEYVDGLRIRDSLFTFMPEGPMWGGNFKGLGMLKQGPAVTRLEMDGNVFPIAGSAATKHPYQNTLTQINGQANFYLDNTSGQIAIGKQGESNSSIYGANDGMFWFFNAKRNLSAGTQYQIETGSKPAEIGYNNGSGKFIFNIGKADNGANQPISGWMPKVEFNLNNSDPGIGEFKFADNAGNLHTLAWRATSPTSGSWQQGDIVYNSKPVIFGSTGNRYIIEGWKRLTSGTSHQLNTDWAELRAFTGQ